MCVIKRKFKLENYKNCFEATQLGNKINYPENTKLTQTVLKSNKQLIRNNKSILKTQKIFKSERHKVSTE